jgi:ribose-phosphate pyrophosphokinase
MQPSESDRVALAVYPTNVGRTLVAHICQHLGVPPASYDERVFEDGEHEMRSLESMRGRDVYVLA